MPYIVTDVKRLARGLRLPSHMAVFDDGRVFVSEFGGGSVHEVSSLSGEEVKSSTLVASGLANPSGLHPTTDGSLLIADAGNGRIVKLSASAASLNMDVISSNHSNPYGIFDYNGDMYSTFSNYRMSGICKVEEGKDFAEDTIFVRDFPVVIQSEPYPELAGCGGSWGGTGNAARMFFSHYALGAVFDVSGGGSFDDLRERRFAWALNGPLGMIADPLDHELCVVEKGTGVIKQIAGKGGNSRFANPLLAGFQEPSCIRFLPDGSAAFVCDRAWGTVFKLALRHIS